uniref:Proteasome subunit beta n=1 Tax=Xenopsylla cheopis TaxID=163159 RepID=A0A6M2DI06_XENCH
MSILGYNGGCVLAMKGKNCVAVATDHKFGIQGMTIGLDFEKVFAVGPHLYLGLPGLATDTQTVFEKLRFRKNLYELRENRKILPKTFAYMTSNFLYEHRFGPYFVEPVIAGLTPDTFEPYICQMDFIGCKSESVDFVVSGTCTEQLYGMCETLYEPDMLPDDLFEIISQAMMNAFDRDAGSGWGATVHILEKDKVTTRKLKTRMD